MLVYNYLAPALAALAFCGVDHYYISAIDASVVCKLSRT